MKCDTEDSSIESGEILAREGAILVCKGIGIQDGLDSHPFLQE